MPVGCWRPQRLPDVPPPRSLLPAATASAEGRLQNLQRNIVLHPLSCPRFYTKEAAVSAMDHLHNRELPDCPGQKARRGGMAARWRPDLVPAHSSRPKRNGPPAAALPGCRRRA